MMLKTKIKSLVATTTLLLMTAPSLATVVVFETSQGEIEVNLFDNATPATVANFLTYVNAGSYNTTVIHRSIPGFIIQGGGFTFNGNSLDEIDNNGTVINEPVYSNVAGTIAMAKVAGNPDSATNQWFFNVADNSDNLDFQNSGFTVFGQVTSGMENLEAIQNLTHCGELPLDDFTAAQCTDDSVAGFENYVSITNIDIADATIDTASALTPTPTKFVETPAVVEEDSGSSSSGGSMGLFSLLLTAAVWLRRKSIMC